MLITGIKSRPVYDELVPLASGLRHVVAAQGSGGAPALRLLREMTPEQRSATAVLYSVESLSGADHLDELREAAAGELEVFPSNAEALAGLDVRLRDATMGTRLYVSGSEGFIGTVMQVASAYGMNADEVLREQAGALARRVWCAHCDTYTENVTRRVFTCPGCGLHLVVRDHYSRRLAAFQGVKADGEVPGEMPDDEELDT